MALSNEMLQTVKMVLNIPSTADASPDHILNQIRDHIRKKRSVALDRMEFEQCRQERDETLDIFYIRLQRIAACADLCPECIDERMTTHVMVGIRDQDTRKKLLAFTPSCAGAKNRPLSMNRPSYEIQKASVASNATSHTTAVAHAVVVTKMVARIAKTLTAQMSGARQKAEPATNATKRTILL